MNETTVGTHAKTTRLSSQELARQLNEHLGATLVAVLAGVRDRKLPYKWAADGGPIPGDERYQKLLAAHRIWTMISQADGAYVARAWFIGANPLLDEQSPVMRLRAGDIPTVLAAAQAFAEGTDE